MIINLYKDCIAIMKRTMLQFHMEVVLLCEEKMTLAKAQNALSVPQIYNSPSTTKTQMELGKTISKHCINCR
jgi:hypothetical protein